MDDTQDKVRRNLVVFSAAILIGWFLDLKLADIVKPLASTDVANVNSGRLWVVIFVVLIYLFLRYRFDDHTKSQIVSLFGELKEQRKNYLSRYLQREINRINRTGKFMSIFSTSLSEAVNQSKKEYEQKYSETILFRLYMDPWSPATQVEIKNADTSWMGAVGISEEYFNGDTSRNFVISSGQRHNFSIPLSGRIWTLIHSIIHIATYSKSAVDLIVPMTLACLAALITTCKLMATYLG